MSVTPTVLIESKQAEATQTTQYTAPVSSASRVIIDKFSATNTSGAPATLAVNLYGSGGVAGMGNQVLYVSIPAGETYLCAEVVGHILGPGGVISTLAGTASAIVIRSSGRVVA